MPLLQSLRRALTVGAVAFAAAARAVAAQPDDRRPTVAVLPFEISAMVSGAEYAPLSRGVAELLTTAMANNPAVRVVERDRLQKLIDEQTLGSGGRVDAETAVRVGKLVGAHHLLTGSFLIDPKKRVVMTVRSIRTETSEVEYAESMRGKADEIFDLIDQMGTKMNAGLKLPPMPVRLNPTREAGATGGSDAKSRRDQLRAAMLLSRALEKQDRGDLQGAIALYKEAVQEDPSRARVQTLLASAERRAGSSSAPPP